MRDPTNFLKTSLTINYIAYLNQKLKVRIVRLGDFTVSVLSVFAIKVDTLNYGIMLEHTDIFE